MSNAWPLAWCQKALASLPPRPRRSAFRHLSEVRGALVRACTRPLARRYLLVLTQPRAALDSPRRLNFLSVEKYYTLTKLANLLSEIKKSDR